jgi:hypothetical protein
VTRISEPAFQRDCIHRVCHFTHRTYNCRLPERKRACAQSGDEIYVDINASRFLRAASQTGRRGNLKLQASLRAIKTYRLGSGTGIISVPRNETITVARHELAACWSTIFPRISHGSPLCSYRSAGKESSCPAEVGALQSFRVFSAPPFTGTFLAASPPLQSR